MSQPSHIRRAKRQRAEQRFRFYGLCAVSFAACALVLLLISIASPAWRGMQHTIVTLDVPDDIAYIAPVSTPDRWMHALLMRHHSDAQSRAQQQALMRMIGAHAYKSVQAWNAAQTKTDTIQLPLASFVDLWLKEGANQDNAPRYGITPQQHDWIKSWIEQGRIEQSFDLGFLYRPDSREAEKAGMGGSILGSLMVVTVCLLMSLPIGIATAIYLEEFMRPSSLRNIIEVNINNLAAIPSIIYGLLGLFLYLGLFGMPRSSALVGGLTLSFMTLPVIVIATRIALAAVPQSLRDAARGIGASPMQVVMHHVVPQALAGIMTGTILAIARALGETAPLLMIGMVAFIANNPHGIYDATTAMPVQIYLWSSNPEQGFLDKTASAIMILIMVLLLLNMIANYIRTYAEQRHKG